MKPTRYEVFAISQGELDYDGRVAWLRILVALDEIEFGEVVANGGQGRGTRYRDMRLDGQSHKFALMISSRQFPGVKTDSVFNEGKFSGSGGSGCAAKENYYRTQAEKGGFSTNGKWYCGSLARFPGDPEAFIGSRSDVLAVCKKNNFTILDGYVDYKGHETPPTPDYEVAPGLIDRETREVMEDCPGSRYEDVYERVHELRTGRIDPNPARVKTPTEDW
jgi:hypothetical protein